MNLRTSYFLTAMASALAIFSSSQFIDSAIAAEPLQITGPDGEMRQANRQYGPTTSSDTFWSIAQKMRPDPSVSIYQVMAAIYDANPHAFTSANFNSLEKGMILLIPSQESMLAIPKSLAKKRAEGDDKSWRKATEKPKAVKAADSPPKVALTPAVKVEDLAEVKMLTQKLEQAQARNLALTDELARAQDTVTVTDTDFSALEAQTEELKEKVAMLEETLLAVKQQNAELRLKNLELEKSLTKATEEVPSDLWRTIMGNPLYLVVVTAVPALLLLALLWIFLRRRRNKDTEALAQDSEARMGGTDDAIAKEEANSDLDLNKDADSIDDLLGMDSAELQPEVNLAGDEADLFVESEEEALGALDEEDDDEGQSLDDLWAEAMGDDEPVPESTEEEPGEFDAMFEGLEDEAPEEDLDSLLADLDMPEEQKAGSTESDDDLSGLVNELDQVADENVENLSASIEADDLQAAIAAELDTESELQSSVIDDDDIDALLAGLDEPSADEQVPETAPVEDIEDIDALLADFDGQSDDEEASQEKEPEASSDSSSDDIDSLLAEFDADVDTDNTLESTPDEIQLDSPEVDTDDIDSLLADLDTPSSDDDVSLDTSVSEVNESNDISDLDAMMAELDSDKSTDLDVDTLGTEELDSSNSLQVEDEAVDALAASDSSPMELDAQEAAPSDGDPLDELLADLDVQGDDSLEVAENSEAAETGFFNDLKASKSNTSDANMLEWESPTITSPKEEVSAEAAEEIISQEFVADEEVADDITLESQTTDELDISDDISALKGADALAELDTGALELDENKESLDEIAPTIQAEPEIKDEDLLAAFSENVELDMSEVDTAEEDFVLDADAANLTVDQALAALDAETEMKQAPLPEHDLANFQQENGFIDIDKLLNEASEGESETDPYKDLDMDMGDMNALMGSGEPVDVDDEENSVNAKLDLARAYIEIDDKDSAKALLQEVVLDGNERQKAESEILLKDMG